MLQTADSAIRGHADEQVDDGHRISRIGGEQMVVRCIAANDRRLSVMRIEAGSDQTLTGDRAAPQEPRQRVSGSTDPPMKRYRGNINVSIPHSSGRVATASCR
jgi:hypothetical protein